MATGTVKWFNKMKCFGFLTKDETGRDIFVHISAVEKAGYDNLNEGQKLSFDIQRDPKKNKKSAANLKKVA